MRNYKLDSAPLLVVGGGGHAASIIDMLQESECQLLGYTDPVDHGDIHGAPYLGDDSVIERDFPHASLIMGLTYTHSAKDLSVRYRLIDRYRDQFSFPMIASKHAIFANDATLGDGSVVMHRAVIGPRVSIGAFSLINTAAVVEHDCRVGEQVVIASGATVGGGTVLGDRTFVGLGAVIVDGIEVGHDCIIGAGAVVVASVPDGMLALGVPAKLKPR